MRMKKHLTNQLAKVASASAAAAATDIARARILADFDRLWPGTFANWGARACASPVASLMASATTAATCSALPSGSLSRLPAVCAAGSTRAASDGKACTSRRSAQIAT